MFMKLEELSIPEEVISSVKVLLETGRFPHAVIIEGGRASDRRKLAGFISQYLVCSGSEKPCGRCSGCIKAQSVSHADIINFSVEDKPKAFKVDMVREIRRMSYIVPNEADRKVFVLENAHTMGAEGQNAFLKVLEEPPAYVNFILLCSTKSNFLTTVLSRATVITLGDNVNDLQDSSGREKASDTACSIAKAVLSPDEFDILAAASVFEKDKALLPLTLEYLEEIFASALHAKYGCSYEDEFTDLPTLIANTLTAGRILALTESVRELQDSVSRNANHNLTITRLCTLLRRAAQAE